jgi:hypothetical protein
MRLSLGRGKGGALAMIGGGLMTGTKVADWEKDFFSIFVKCKSEQNIDVSDCEI